METPFKALGRKTTGPSRELETFPKPGHVTSVKFTSHELASLCPVTGQPDIYSVEIIFLPDGLCLESKSLKLYLWSFRDERMFAETLAHTIVGDIHTATQAHYCKVTLIQNVRGGLALETVAEIGQSHE
jgi:7-cyano-7-deazaguanine reductase